MATPAPHPAPSASLPVAPASAKQIAQAAPPAPPPTPTVSASTPGPDVACDGTFAPPKMEDIFSSDGKVDMRLLMMSLWKNRRNAAFTAALCQRLTYLTISNPTLDQVEAYLPQLAHMVVHFEKELPIEAMEQFVLLLSQSSVHFALQLFWIIYAALDENRPKRNGNPRTFARCTQLLLALEQCLVYGSPVAREVSELLTRNSISKAEMEQILMADRRFFAAQSAMEGNDSVAERALAEGWLHKKGGGTSKMGRRNWKLRWCRIEKRMLLVFSGPTDVHPRTAVPLDRAEVRVVENPKHPFYFELIHEFSETKMKFAANSQEELVTWVQHLHKTASAPAPPTSTTPIKASPQQTLARMSWAMRSFILQSTGGTETPQDGSPIKADTTLAPPSSPPKSPRSKTAPPTSGFGADDAWSESQRRGRTVSSVSSASANSVEVGETSAMLTETILLQPQVPLLFDQQRRYEFFTGMINFVKAITDVSEALRRVEPPKRKSQLRPRLERLTIPANAYIPLCKSTDPYCRVLSVFASEGRVFSTNERAPCLLFFDTESNEHGHDVSQALFDHLYADESSGDDESFDPEPAVVVIGTDDDALGLNDASSGVRDLHTFNYTSPAPNPFIQQLLATPERRQRVERIFGELSYSASERLRDASECADPQRWRLCTLIAKSYDDLRQEVLVMQLISHFQHIFLLEELPLRLHPYRILSTGASTGLIEVVRNATSLDGIKKTPGFKNLRHHFEQLYGSADEESATDGTDSELLRQAELNFIHSLAAYSIVCYILCIKDRHNGNIMLDVEGHIVHIDFGFFLGRAPGGSFSFETAPFKLTAEMVDVLGGRNSSHFKYFSDLCVKGALAARKHADTIYTLVEVMSFHSRLPCFATNAAVALSGLRDRLFLNIQEEKVEPAILSMIERSYDHFGTNKYDQFQVYSNGIAK